MNSAREQQKIRLRAKYWHPIRSWHWGFYKLKFDTLISFLQQATHSGCLRNPKTIRMPYEMHTSWRRYVGTVSFKDQWFIKRSYFLLKKTWANVEPRNAWIVPIENHAILVLNEKEWTSVSFMSSPATLNESQTNSADLYGFISIYMDLWWLMIIQHRRFSCWTTVNRWAACHRSIPMRFQHFLRSQSLNLWCMQMDLIQNFPKWCSFCWAHLLMIGVWK